MAKGQLNYDVVGVGVSEMGRMLLGSYFGGLKRGRMPWSSVVWGPPGVGKTFKVIEVVRLITRRLGLDTPCEIIELSTSCLEPVDVTGLPGPVLVNGIAKYSQYLPMEWAYRVSTQYEIDQRVERNDPKWEAPPIILMFDDVTAAHMQTQTAFYKGIHQGIWGCYQQRDNVMAVGCGNRSYDNAGANEMSCAFGTRVRHIYIKLSTKEWLWWAKGHREVDEPGPKGEARIHPLVSGWVQKSPDMLLETSKDVTTREEKASCNPRSVHNMSELMFEDECVPKGIADGTIENAPGENEDRFFAKSCIGIIGIGHASHFLAYLLNSEALISPEAIVKDPEGAHVPGQENPDALHATACSLEEYVKQNPIEAWESALIYAMRDEIRKDVGMCIAKTVVMQVARFGPEERAEAMMSDSMENALDTFHNLIDCMDLDYPTGR